MTHAPGALGLPKREEPKADESFAGKLLNLAGLGKKGPGDKPGGKPGRGLTDSAGREAFGRVRDANRRQQKKKEVDLNKTLAGASKHIDASPTKGVVTGMPSAGPVVATAAPQDTGPGFLSLVPGALITPLRGLPVTLVHLVILFMALMLLELSPVVGLIACAMAAAEVVSLRVRLMRDGCAGRDAVPWPEFSEIFGATTPYLASWLLFLPAVVLALVVWGGAAFEETPASLGARAKRIAQPVPTLEEGESLPEGVGLGHSSLLMVEALVARAPGPTTRTTDAVASDLSKAVAERGRELVDIDNATGPGLGARVMVFLGFLGFPMAMLCAVRLRSAYAAVFAPLILRSMLRIPGVYLIVLLVFAVESALLLGVFFAGGPVFRDQLGGTPGHLAWVGALSLLVVASQMVTGALLGRMYRTKQLALEWD